MARVITFGEIMIRLETPGYLRFNQAKQFEATFGGGEANVAVSLANYGLEAEFVTRFPKNDIAKAASRIYIAMALAPSIVSLVVTVLVSISLRPVLWHVQVNQ